MADNYKGKGSINFYAGADYGFNSNYGKEFSLGLKGEYNIPFSTFGFTTDGRTANQLSAVSQKLNTGAKTIEVQGVSAQELESIPDQHFKEINRLKELTGVDLTFHGPIVEPSGYGEGGWTETARKGAERQMFSAVERGQRMEPTGNIVITFHSTAGLPELTQRMMTKEGEKVTEIVAYDEREGGATKIKPKENFLLGEKPDPYKELDKMNKERWFRELTHLTFNANQGISHIEDPLRGVKGELDPKKFLHLYKKSKTDEWQSYLNSLENENEKKMTLHVVNNMNFGEVYVRDSYIDLQDKFNKAYLAIEKDGEKGKEDLQKLDAYKKELKKALEKGNFDDPSNLIELGAEVNKGVNVLNSLSNPPRTLKPMSEFVIDKSSETFSNIAFDAYKEFKNNAPIISIENPPAGGGLSHADDLRKLIDETRKKFENRAVEDLGMSQRQAKEQAEKLIGVTWDVGHINMLRKYGYSDKDLQKQTEKVAEVIKHVHLSDNFGYEHTELPMGMGNVPMKQHLEAMKNYGVQLDKIKKVVETGGAWFRDFKATPIRETLVAFGSPIYSMQMAPTWNQASHSSGGYFAGYGKMLPDTHFSLYGSGFSNLPVELGGQMSGRSRVSGNPID